MPLKESNQMIYVAIPKELVATIDKDAAKEARTRSKQILKVLMDYYEKKEMNNG